MMAQLDGAVVTLALPAMAKSFGIPAIQLTIGITSYLLVQVIVLPTGGWLTDRFGSRNVFAAAIAVFTAASVGCGVSRSLPLFVAARLVQGAAAALMGPVGRIVLLESTAKEDLIRIMTITTVPNLLAPTVGPALGGLITTYSSWPWIFLLNVPFGMVGTWYALRLIADGGQRTRRPFDVTGFLLFAGTSAAVLYALEWLAADFPRWHRGALLGAVGAGLGTAAIYHVRRADHPIVSLAAAQIRTFAIATLRGGALIRVALRAAPYLLPIMFQLAMGMTALQAGVMLLALNGGDLMLKGLIARTLRGHGFRRVLLLTTTLSSMLFAACALFSLGTPRLIVFGALLASGMVRSLLLSGVNALVFADVPRADVGSATIIWNMILQTTNALGVSVSALLLAISAHLGGEAPGQLTLHDFRVAIVVLAAVGMTSLLSLRRLPHDAGAHVSGHRP
jgi:MFS family permease